MIHFVVAVVVILTIQLPSIYSSTSYPAATSPVSIAPNRDEHRYTMETVESSAKVSNAVGSHPSDANMLYIESILSSLQRKYGHQPVFLQSVQEMVLSIQDLLLLENDDQYRKAFALLIEPERTISFRISWIDDQGVQQVNRGWRVEFNRYCF